MREESLYLRKNMDIYRAGNIFLITIDILIILRIDMVNIISNSANQIWKRFLTVY